MSMDIAIFKNEEFGQVRSVMIGDEPWFVGKDVAEALGYVKARNAIANHVEEDDKKDAPIQGDRGGAQAMTIINESGLYALIFGSKLESAKRFKRWVTSEVLPAIRRTGRYEMPKQKELISANELAGILKRKQCKVCYRIDGLIRKHPEYQKDFVPGTFENAQGRSFRTYYLTEEGLRIFIRLLEADGTRNSVNTVRGIQMIRSMYPGIVKNMLTERKSEVFVGTGTLRQRFQKAEAVLEMFEQYYLGKNFSEFDEEEKNRFDAALCLLHDQVKEILSKVTESERGEKLSFW